MIRAVAVFGIIATMAGAQAGSPSVNPRHTRLECGVLQRSEAQQALQSALADVLLTYQPGVATAQLLRTFRNRANARASQLGLVLKKELDELSPYQLENCIIGARLVFEYLAGDLNGGGLHARLMELYCRANQSRCTDISRGQAESR